MKVIIDKASKAWKVLQLRMAGKYKRFKRPVCDFTGKSGTLLNPLEVHHGGKTHAQIVQEFIDDTILFERALYLINDDVVNYFTFTRKVHFVMHLEDWKKINPNVKAIVEANKGGI